MFCPECGKRNDVNAKFCVNCGAQLCNPKLSASTTAPTIPNAPHALQTHSETSQKPNLGTAAVLDIIMIGLTFFPWLYIDVYAWSGSYSVPDLIRYAFELNNQATNLLSSSYINSDIQSTILGLGIVLGMLWLIVVCILGVDAYKKFTNKEFIKTTGASITYLLYIVAVGGICSYADSSIGGSNVCIALNIWACISFFFSAAFVGYIKRLKAMLKN